MSKKIVLITSSHLSSNPRLVKEAKALLNAGYDLQILCAQNMSSLATFDNDIFTELKNSKIKIINYQNKGIVPKYLRLKSALRAKLAKIKYFNFIPSLKWLAQSRMLPEMKHALTGVKADLYIAHTLAALPAAAWAANYHKSRYSFDAEDFHRGETNDKNQQEQVILLEDYFLPRCSYISTASPLATDIYKQLYPKSVIFTINNFFPFTAASINHTINDTIKIVWFSQTIGLNRGLQEFLQVLIDLNPQSYELHLRGDHTEDLKLELLSLLPDEWKDRLFFYPQCSSIYLEEWLKGFDIGLALENKLTFNRDICITNKIFQYISSGLAIIATNTQGQRWVFEQEPEIGIIVEEKQMQIAINQLKSWHQNKSALEITKQKSTNAAKSIFNWDLEKNKFLKQISSLFSAN